MNGISFSDFENSSFDSLYDRGFAGAKEFDRFAKDMKPGDFAMKLENGRPVSSLGDVGGLHAVRTSTVAPVDRRRSWDKEIRREVVADSGRQHRSLTAPKLDRSVPARTQQPPHSSLPGIPLNDMTMLPGNSRVEHAWMPSREADARAKGADLAAPSRPALPAQAASSGGGNKGAFVNWNSN